MNQIIKATVQQAFEKNKKDLKNLERDIQTYAGELEFASEQYASAVKLVAKITDEQKELTRFLGQEDGVPQQTQVPAQDAIEAEIQDKGANVAQRITPADIEANIVSEHYFTAAEGCSGHCNMVIDPCDWVKPLNLLTFCVLVLRNGFTVTGESACASPENFNAEIGQRIARENAKAKIWPLMGYELRTKLATAA